MFHVGDMPDELGSELLEKTTQISTATIGHFMTDGFMDKDIRPLASGQRIAGCAVTLAFSGQDSTILHHAVGLLRPHDILVISRLGDERHACIGGGVGFAAKKSGALGAIIDGPCTDPEELNDIDFPVWCKGISPITTRVLGQGGSMNAQICCGGAMIFPGDLIIADSSGVVAVSCAQAKAIVEAAVKREQQSLNNVERVKNGESLGNCSGATQMVLDNLTNNKQL